MKKFESGEIVVFNNLEYIYLCQHPKNNSLSVLELVQPSYQPRSLDCVITEHLNRKPKTHRVNGFEVPAPITLEEFYILDLNDVIFSFSVDQEKTFAPTLKRLVAISGVKCGLVFKTESDIKHNILAMQGIDPNQSK